MLTAGVARGGEEFAENARSTVLDAWLKAEARSQERAEARQPVPGLRVRLERPSGEEVDSEHQTRPQEGLYDVHE
jgi:hypothetical protein